MPKTTETTFVNTKTNFVNTKTDKPNGVRLGNISTEVVYTDRMTPNIKVPFTSYLKYEF